MHTVRLISSINSERPELININPVVYVSWLRNLLCMTEQKYTELNYLYPLYKLVNDPGISFEHYVERINNYYFLPGNPLYSQKSILPFLYASYFLICYIEKNHECLTGDIFFSMHKLFAAAFQIGAKLFYDEYPITAYSASVFGVCPNELSVIEWDFFARLDADVRADTADINRLMSSYLHTLQLAHVPRPIVWTIWNLPTVYPSTDVRQPARRFHP